MSRRSQQPSAAPLHDAEVRRRELGDISALLATECGRRLMWRVLSIAGIFRNSFTGTSETFFNEGKRAIGTTLLADLMEAEPEAFALMQREAVAQAENDALAIEVETREMKSDG